MKSVTKEYIPQSVVRAEKGNVQRKVDMAYVETVYTIEPKTGDVERLREDFTKIVMKWPGNYQ